MHQTSPSHTLPSPEVRHLEPLDGIRGLAIAMVLATHCFAANFYGHSVLLRTVGVVLDAGRFGVDLFFVLSGFLITGILIDTRHDPHFFRNFFGRRALRIMPLYYGVLGVLMLLSVPLHWEWKGMLPLLLLYLQNLRPVAIDTLWIGPGIGLFHFWSLAIEEQFYLLWPPLVFLLGGDRRKVFYAALLGSLLVLALRVVLAAKQVPYLWIHMSLFTRADSLLVGGMLAACYRSESAWKQVERFSPAAFLLVGGATFLPMFFKGLMAGPPLWILAFRYSALAMTFGALICWSLKPGTTLRRLCEVAPLRSLGKYSYGLYVLHVIVLAFVRLQLRQQLMLVTGNALFSIAVTGVVSIALACLAAYLSYRFYERPFLRLKKHFRYTQIEPARVTAAPAVSAT